MKNLFNEAIGKTDRQDVQDRNERFLMERLSL